MEIMPIYLFGLGALLLLGTAAFFRAAYLRMRGRRSRFDHAVETFVRAQSMQVYPPSLRPEPVPPLITEEDPAGDRLPPDVQYPLPRPRGGGLRRRGRPKRRAA